MAAGGEERRAVTPDDLLGLGLLLCGLVGVGLSADLWWPLLPFFAAALAQPALYPRFGPRSEVGLLGYVGLAVPFALLRVTVPVMGDARLGFDALFYMALYLIAIGLMRLYGPPGHTRARWALGCSAAGMSCAGHGVTHREYFALVVVWCALAAVVLRRQLRDRAAPSGGLAARRAVAAFALVGAAAVTFGAVRALESNYQDLNRSIWRLLRGAPDVGTGAFNETAQLGDVVRRQARGGDGVALRAYAEQAPGYLRAKVYRVYVSGRWQADPAADSSEVMGVTGGRLLIPGRPAPAPDAEPAMRVYPEIRSEGRFFLPLETAVVDGAGASVVVGPGQVIATADGTEASGYGAILVEDAPWTAGGDDPFWRWMPQDAPELVATLDRRLRALGLEPGGAASADGRAIEAAVAALVADFARRYVYQVGIDFDEEGPDPLVQFLESKDHGHCELFASSGTMLLRRLGVPARYVTGFVCEERNGWSSSLFVARNRHAHAWIEYLHPERGWQLAEMTPSTGVPATEPVTGGLFSFLEWLGGLFAWIKTTILRDGVGGLLALAREAFASALAWLIGAWWRPVIVAAVVAAVIGAVLVRRRRARFAPAATRTLPAELARDRDRLLRLERQLARVGLARADAETLDEWAARLREAPAAVAAESVAFVESYAARRYARPS